MRHERRGARVPRPRHSRARQAVPRRPRDCNEAAAETDGTTARMTLRDPQGHPEYSRGVTIIFWVIDGTLLTTGKAGVPAWEAAVREVTGKDFELSSIRVPGLTDFQIAARTFELLGIPAEADVIARMVSGYEARLPVSLPL